MLLEILTMCSLISVSPFYDCSEKWEIRLYSEYPTIQCNNHDQHLVSLGCAHLDRNIIHIINDSDYRDEFGQTILTHELRHLKCKCNFHS